MTMREIDFVRGVYCTALRDGSATAARIAAFTGLPEEEVAATAVEAERHGLVESAGGGFALTPEGRGRLKVVMIGGAFEIIHPGHLHTVEQAKRLGDTLVAVVATDKSVSKNKGRDPVTSQEWRVKLVGAVRNVDLALPGGQGSIYDTLDRVRPDVVALGYDQIHKPADIEAEAKRRGLQLTVARLSSPLPGVKTSKIVSAL